MTAMEDGDRDSISNSGVIVEDNSIQLLQDSDSASSTKVAKAGPEIATLMGGCTSIIFRSLTKVQRI